MCTYTCAWQGVSGMLVFRKILRTYFMFDACEWSEKSFFKKIPISKIFDRRRIRHRCFPVNFYEKLKNNFFTEHLRVTASALIGETCQWIRKNFLKYSFWQQNDHKPCKNIKYWIFNLTPPLLYISRRTYLISI